MSQLSLDLDNDTDSKTEDSKESTGKAAAKTADKSTSLSTKLPVKPGVKKAKKKVVKVRDGDASSSRVESMPAEDDVNIKSEPKVITVSELNKKIKSIIEGNFPSLWIQGELSNFVAHSSGHYYFSLKDKKSQISAVMFKGLNSKLKFKPKTGMEVLIRAKVTVYEPRGNYQLFCEVMEPVGAGALQIAFEQLKAKLKSEGLFDPKIKKAIPTMPKHIGVITSPTGAAVRDIINVITRRFSGAKITVIPTLVQGAGAAPDVVKSIDKAEAFSASEGNEMDVLIVGRGGGSVEDLWAFNEEVVARAIYNCPIPIISAVGHEIDFTIADFVADLRAPTPSAAAELAVKNTVEISNQLVLLKKRLYLSQVNLFKELKTGVVALSKRLIDPKRRLQDLQIRCDELTTRLENSMSRKIVNQKNYLALTTKRIAHPQQKINIEKQKIQGLYKNLVMQINNNIQTKKSELGHHISMLDSLSPLKVVERGFSIVKAKTKDGKRIVIKSIKTIKVKDELSIKLSDGEVTASVVSISKQE